MGLQSPHSLCTVSIQSPPMLGKLPWLTSAPLSLSSRRMSARCFIRRYCKQKGTVRRHAVLRGDSTDRPQQQQLHSRRNEASMPRHRPHLVLPQLRKAGLVVVIDLEHVLVVKVLVAEVTQDLHLLLRLQLHKMMGGQHLTKRVSAWWCGTRLARLTGVSQLTRNTVQIKGM